MEYKFKDIHNIIRDALFEECYQSDYGWTDFIKHKNLGIHYIGLGFANEMVYEIIDEKQWMLAKIKHGI